MTTQKPSDPDPHARTTHTPSDPDTTARLAHDVNRDAPRMATTNAPAHAHHDHLVAPEGSPKSFGTILLEDGSRAEASEPHARTFRVRAGGAFYEHVSDGPGGEWVYRLSK